MNIIETDRLILRKLNVDDAEFILLKEFERIIRLSENDVELKLFTSEV